MRGTSLGAQMRLDSSAYLATKRSVFFSPAPPISTGIFDSGAGELMASVTRYHRPRNVGLSPASIPFTIWSDSSSRSKRSVKVPNSNPRLSCSSSNQPAPMPNWARPPETWSSVVSSLASRAGFR